MNKTLKKRFRDNILLFSLVLAVIFASINLILYLLNQAYLEQKIEEENNAFLVLTTHLVNENDIDVALEYVEHYTHTHDVEIEVTDSNDVMLYSSAISYRFSRQYEITTNKGIYNIYMDNTSSVTVLTVQQNFLYVNITLFVIYLVAVVVLYYVNKTSTRNIETDLNKVLYLVDEQTPYAEDFSYTEFHIIYNEIAEYLEKIDLLQEQKQFNVKGLAHDIKTPLTILYGFIDKYKRQEDITSDEATHAFEAAQSINTLVDDLIQENFEQNKHLIALDEVIQDTVESYQTVFDNKDMIVRTTLSSVVVKWNKKDAKRIIENILANAYQYSQPGSEVLIELQQKNNIHVTITSTPIHIESIHLIKIFDKGYSETNRKNKGLGLYLCKLLLLPVNGTIEAQINKNEFIIAITI